MYLHSIMGIMYSLDVAQLLNVYSTVYIASTYLSI